VHRPALPARGAALAAAALLAAGCAGTSRDVTGATTAPPATAPTAATPGATTAAPSATAPAVQTISITYANGKVSGAPSRVRVSRGSRVALIVTSDVADEVHLHGYDKSADVAKGGTATITFTATSSGIFTVELEHLKRRLVQIAVT
jgi:plastocyanin